MAADTVALSALTLARGDKILVTIESALPDIIVVSFVHGAKCFQGALLDATKRWIIYISPCNINHITAGSVRIIHRWNTLQPECTSF